MSSDEPIRWNDGFHQNLPYGEKVAIIRSYLENYGIRNMVETGLYNGHGSGMECRDLLDWYLVIDFDPDQVAVASERMFSGNPNGKDAWGTAYLGDSAVVLDVLLRGNAVPSRSLFWLDAHTWHGDEFGDKPPSEGQPLLRELDSILAWPHAAESVVLIDDLRQMGGYGWPSLEELRAKVAGGPWAITEADDIMRCVPPERSLP